MVCRARPPESVRCVERARRGSHHVQVTHELENQYEHKLALEMERYDRLSEEIEAIQQRCEGLLQAQAAEHEGAIRDAEGRTKRVEKELRQQIERLHEDAKHNEQMFREVHSRIFIIYPSRPNLEFT